MAVVLLKSAPITTMDSFATVNPYLSSQSPRSAVGQSAVANGDSIASIYRLVRIPSNARMDELNLYCPAITTCAGSFGLYRTTVDGGAVVSVAFFATAQSLAAALTGTNIVGLNLYTAALSEKRVWEVLGLTVDPVIYYDVACTLTAAAASAGAIAVKAKWVI